MPFRFLEEIATADVAIEIWGTSLVELFQEAVEATLAVMVNRPGQVAMQERRSVELTAATPDLLLVAFLNELIFLKDAEQLLLHAEVVTIEGSADSLSLHAVFAGERIAPKRHHLLVDVKAATLHQLWIGETEKGVTGRVILDI